jgi:hypothetical protein
MSIDVADAASAECAITNQMKHLLIRGDACDGYSLQFFEDASRIAEPPECDLPDDERV